MKHGRRPSAAETMDEERIPRTCLSSFFNPQSSSFFSRSLLFSPHSSLFHGLLQVLKDIAAAHGTGRNSIGIDIDPQYCRFALHRLDAESGPLFGHAGIEYRKAEDLMVSATVTAVAEGTR
ncbi:site-specific DNA-methyltransferase, partial [candidate division WOR-3 bacterium]|nr:site-specific DNA-methyltransferase [candidate division WOR-3 bacterium]